MRRFGSRQVRESGTVGGNIANGSPIGDLAPALIALGASDEQGIPVTGDSDDQAESGRCHRTSA